MTHPYRENAAPTIESKRRPVPTTIPGGDGQVNKWLLQWSEERRELERLEATIPDASAAAVAEEREACARLAETARDGRIKDGAWDVPLPDAIRARGGSEIRKLQTSTTTDIHTRDIEQLTEQAVALSRELSAEKARADAERQRADAERQRADAAERERDAARAVLNDTKVYLQRFGGTIGTCVNAVKRIDEYLAAIATPDALASPATATKTDVVVEVSTKEAIAALRAAEKRIQELEASPKCSACGRAIEEENAYAQGGKVFHPACWRGRDDSLDTHTGEKK